MAQEKNPKSAAGRDDDYAGTTFSMTGIRGLLVNSIMWKAVLGLLIFIFAVGFAFTAGGPGPNGDERPVVSTGPSLVASVGKQTIERARYEEYVQRQARMMEQFGQTTDAMGLMGSRQRSLDGLTENAAQFDTAVELGMTPSNDEVTAEIAKKVKEQIKQQTGDNPAAFRRQIEKQYGSLARYEEDLKGNLEAQREGVSHDLAVEKLKKSIEEKNKVTEDDYKRSVTKLELFNIVVRPKPNDPLKDKDMKLATEQHKAEAKTKAEKLVASLKNATLAQFKAAAKKDSDDLTTKPKGGELGWKKPSEMSAPPEVQEAVAASTGKIVGPLDDKYSGGWAIFYINNRKVELPKDYAKTKDKTLKDFETTKDGEAWTKYTDELKKQKPVQIHDPALAAYDLQNNKIFAATGDEQKKLRQEAMSKYQEALTGASSEDAAAIHYQLSQLYQQEAQPEKAIDALKEAVKESGGDANLQVQLGSQLHFAKKTKEGIEVLQAASKRLDERPSKPSMFGGYDPDDQLRDQLAQNFEMMGRKDLAAAERKKKKPAPKPGMGNSPFNLKMN